jgi:hypothetical protein
LNKKVQKYNFVFTLFCAMGARPPPAQGPGPGNAGEKEKVGEGGKEQNKKNKKK